MNASFSIDLRVHDTEALFNAAYEHYCEENLNCKDVRREVIELLKPDGKTDVQACLIELLDPGSLMGCSINGSSAEVHP